MDTREGYVSLSVFDTISSMTPEEDLHSPEQKQETSQEVPPEALTAYEKAREFYNYCFDERPVLRKKQKEADYNRLTTKLFFLQEFFPLLYEEVLAERIRREEQTPPKRRRLRKKQDNE